MDTQPAFAPALLPLHITRRAFQDRFPLMVDGVSRKYDAVSLFLADAAYATALEPDDAKRTTLKLQIQAGLNRIAASGYVDLGLQDAALFTGLLMQAHIPAAFRLSAGERAAILSPVIADTERPA
jgi:hypothetical protein